MTQEEVEMERVRLRDAILQALPASARTIAQADAVVRLVVEACIIELVEKAGQPFAAAVLRHTFLPTTEHTDD